MYGHQTNPTWKCSCFGEGFALKDFLEDFRFDHACYSHNTDRKVNLFGNPYDLQYLCLVDHSDLLVYVGCVPLGACNNHSTFASENGLDQNSCEDGDLEVVWEMMSVDRGEGGDGCGGVVVVAKAVVGDDFGGDDGGDEGVAGCRCSGSELRLGSYGCSGNCHQDCTS